MEEQKQSTTTYSANQIISLCIDPDPIDGTEIHSGKIARNIAYRLICGYDLYEVTLVGIDETGQPLRLDDQCRSFAFIEEAENYVNQLREDFIV